MKDDAVAKPMTLDGRSLGEALYNAMAEPFLFTGKWGASPATCAKYEAAAEAFAARIVEACAQAAEAQDRTGREWVRESLWAQILRRAGQNVRSLTGGERHG